MVRRILQILVILVLIIGGIAVYAFWPRKGNLRQFDPDAVGRLETAMWRDYYGKDYQSLAAHLYSLYRDQYHFSPGDSSLLALYSGRAAQTFQPTQSRGEAMNALPSLVSYFTLLRDRSGEQFDSQKAAEMELDWWQLRRENVAWQKYGKVVANVTEELFHVKGDHVDKSAQLRAEMMRYRDDRRGRMQNEDWDHIEKQLIEAYRELKLGVAPNS